MRVQRTEIIEIDATPEMLEEYIWSVDAEYQAKLLIAIANRLHKEPANVFSQILGIYENLLACENEQRARVENLIEALREYLINGGV